MVGIPYSAIIGILSLFFLIVALNAKRPRMKIDYFPPVSVISWFWKDGNIVERKIKNLLDLDYPGKFEIIIIDNASEDETQEICKKYAKKGLIKYYRTPKQYDRKGISLDYTIKNVAKYDILAMTDPDGLCKKDWLKKIVQPFKDKKVGAVIGLTHAGNFYKNLFTKLRAVEDEWFYVIAVLGRQSRTDVNLVCGANYAVTRQALKSVNYHGKKTLGEDYELTIKLYNKGWDVDVADAEVWQEEVETLGEYYRQRVRWHDSSTFGTLFYLPQILRIVKKKFIGAFLFFFMFFINILSFIYLMMIIYGFFYSTNSLISGIVEWIILNISIIIGLYKFKKRDFIPYVPLYLLVEPFLTVFIQVLVVFLRLTGIKIRWRSLHDGYYHAGTRMVMR